MSVFCMILLVASLYSNAGAAELESCDHVDKIIPNVFQLQDGKEGDLQ